MPKHGKAYSHHNIRQLVAIRKAASAKHEQRNAKHAAKMLTDAERLQRRAVRKLVKLLISMDEIQTAIALMRQHLIP